MADEPLCDSLLRNGAQDYLIKGQFSARELKRAIRYAIERQNLIVQLARAREETLLSAILENLTVGVWSVVRLACRMIRQRSFSPLLVGWRQGRSASGSFRSTIAPDAACPRYSS